MIEDPFENAYPRHLARGRTASAVWLLAVFALSLGATACDAWLTKPSLYGSVSVAATRSDGSPVPGVSLVLYTGPRPMGYAITDAMGRFTFSRVPQGNYGVYATPPNGYLGVEYVLGGKPTNFVDRLVVDAGDSARAIRFTFLKKGPGAIVVRVANPDGTAIDSVPVTLYGPTITPRHAPTDAEGRVIFPDLAFGAYGVIINRPVFYRDYRRTGDSLYSSRDNLVVEEGTRDSVAFTLARCAGAIRAVARDQNGSPVRGATVALFTSVKTFGVATTDVNGQTTFDELLCGTQFGVVINPPVGYVAPPGRGTSFLDGLVVTNGTTVDAAFRLQKTP